MKRTILTLAALFCLVLVAHASVTVSGVPAAPERWGRTGVSWGTVTFDDAYASGGELITAGAFGLRGIDRIDITVDSARYLVQYDASETKLRVYTVCDTIAVDVASFKVAGPAVDPDAVTHVVTFAQAANDSLGGLTGVSLIDTVSIDVASTTADSITIDPASTAGTAVLLREVDTDANLSSLVCYVTVYDFPGGN